MPCSAAAAPQLPTFAPLLAPRKAIQLNDCSITVVYTVYRQQHGTIGY